MVIFAFLFIELVFSSVVALVFSGSDVCWLYGPWYRVHLQVGGWQRNRGVLRDKSERDFGKELRSSCLHQEARCPQGVRGGEEMLLKIGCSRTKDMSEETGKKGLGRFWTNTKSWSEWC